MSGPLMADPPSPATARARSLVAKRKGEARTLGTRAAEEATDPAAAAGILRVGLAGLADPEYLAGLQRVAPGIGPTLGVRQPLLTAVGRSLRRGLRSDSSAVRLDLAERLLREEPLELHWLAFGILEQAIVADPERAWQLVRGEARKANDWITVDSLAHVAGRGILAEPYRWSELEQLVYSPSGWERRLVGSTIATIPSLDRDAGRQPAIATRGLTLVTELIGDAQPEVQKALSWALRSLTLVDREATIAFLDREADATRTRDDGLRARVVRDSLEKLPPDVAERLRTKVAGVRTRPRAPSSSRAAATAAAFMGVGLEVPPPESHVIDRS